MTVSVVAIGTAVPDHRIEQESLRDIFLEQRAMGRVEGRLLRAAFDGSAIETRYMMGSGDGTRSHPVLDAGARRLTAASSKVRNDAYIGLAPPLIAAAARQAITESPYESADITHVISVSCTGAFAPGLEYTLMRDLGLGRHTRRLNIGFMGCHAALPALRTGRDICAADPDAVVLVACVELCSLHMRVPVTPDDIVSAAVFADGAAAAVLSAREGAAGGAVVLDFDAMDSVITPTGQQDMAWSVGDSGFDIVLSSYVPHIIEDNILDALKPLATMTRPTSSGPNTVEGWLPSVDRWAIHPGGRSILDRIQAALGLHDELLQPSRDTLRDYGNMSSPTILFVLRTIMKSSSAQGRLVRGEGDSGCAERVAALAFGPGLTVESALFTLRQT